MTGTPEIKGTTETLSFLYVSYTINSFYFLCGCRCSGGTNFRNGVPRESPRRDSTRRLEELHLGVPKTGMEHVHLGGK
jgi:hypothetical protein